ncbi:Lrp/AsnC family transcriptional regulator [Amycolatopsis echigonensis]|uniref:DNA-binding Lrp family transcriptional regulator n=1 Tax=Amycolatopsis echigonensis TaxID=2576905 RepID=A0A2N3WRY0_9PSEU|nr:MULTISPECIES: Lrp/AsnC family transcriptional regulator [Amycolatopsis]MBB2501499.1 Lrp/AsnC family transcriptional regulator [Amycolatopsis echigonensis]PKV96610.1 DNA-binding Lrp family transcriptional regulator [Amycolatopsis niigatensis]
MPSTQRLDATDARILLALGRAPRATAVALADELGLSRNTVQSRLARLEQGDALRSPEHRIDPAALGYPLTAFVTVQARQRLLDEVGRALAAVPEVLQVRGLTGAQDLLVHVVATDADDLYRIAGEILEIPGVERTNNALVMREMVPYRLTPLLERAAGR